MSIKSFIVAQFNRRSTKNLYSEEGVKATVIELLWYLVFLITVTIVAFSTRQVAMFYFTNTIERLFLQRSFLTDGDIELTYEDIVSVEDWWQFMENSFLNGIHAAVENQDELTKREFKTELTLLKESIFLGPPRIRQLKVKNNTCKIHKEFQRYFRSCFSHYSFLNEESNKNNAENSMFTWGQFGMYRGGGFVENFQIGKNENFEILKNLKQKLWIGRGTRMVVVEFNLYNANSNLFCLVKLIAELPPTGGVLATSSVQAFQLLRIGSAYDCFIISCKVFFFLQIVFYTIREILELRVLKWSYFKHFWNWISAIILVIEFTGMVLQCTEPDKLHNNTETRVSFFLILISYHIVYFENNFIAYSRSGQFIRNFWFNSLPSSKLEDVRYRKCDPFPMMLCSGRIKIGYLTVLFTIIRHAYMATLLMQYNKVPHKYINLDFIGFWQYQYTNIMAICAFLVWIQIFKYISFNKTMLQFSTTLRRCALDLMGFGVMFFIVFIAFAQLGYLLFGTENSNFRTLTDSIFTMMRTILGDFEYLAIERSNRILGPIYFLTYIFFVFFVLLNMFLAIINDTYSEVKSEITEDNIFLWNFLRKMLSRLCRCLCCGKAIYKSEENIKELSDARYEPKSVGKSSAGENGKPVESNFLPLEEKIVVRKKDLLGKLFKELEPEEANEVNLTQDQLDSFNERLRNLERIMDNFVFRMDSLIHKLDSTPSRGV